MALSTPSPPPFVPPTQAQVAPTPTPPVGERPKKKSMQPTFLGEAGVQPNQGGVSGKTLLGQ